MNPHQTDLLEQFTLASKYGGAVGQRPEHEGTPRTYFGLRNGVRRAVIQGWIDDHQDIAYDDWVALIDALYHGQSYEERCTPPTLLAKFPEYRQQLLSLSLTCGWDSWKGGQKSIAPANPPSRQASCSLDGTTGNPCYNASHRTITSTNDAPRLSY